MCGDRRIANEEFCQEPLGQDLHAGFHRAEKMSACLPAGQEFLRSGVKHSSALIAVRNIF